MEWVFLKLLKPLKQYRTIEQMCSDAHSITLNILSQHSYSDQGKVLRHKSLNRNHQTAIIVEY